MSIPPAGLADAVMACARNYPPGVEGCLAWMECRLVEEIARERFVLIIGEVLRLEADDRLFNDDGEMDYERAMPLSVVAGKKGMWFTRPVFAGRRAEYAEMFVKGRDEAPTMVDGLGNRE